MVCDRFDEEVIGDLGEDSKVANWFNRNYDQAKRLLLSTGRWNFARARVTLPQVAGYVPDTEWQYAYRVPGDLMLLYRLTHDGSKNGFPVPYTIEGDLILTNQTPLRIRYTQNVTEEKFNPVFVNLLVAHMAHEMAHWMTGKVSYVDITERKLKQATRAANLYNAMQEDQADPAPEEVIYTRYT